MWTAPVSGRCGGRSSSCRCLSARCCSSPGSTRSGPTSGTTRRRCEQERQEIEAENRHLLLELATLREPGRIERLATRDLHLVAPSQTEAVVLVIVRDAATPARTLVARR